MSCTALHCTGLTAQVLLLPWWTFLLVAVKALVPEPASMRLGNAFGFNCSMDQFRGREKKLN